MSGLSQATCDAANARLDYSLGYTRAESSREGTLHGLSGPRIPNAYRNPHSAEFSGGDWEDEDLWHVVPDDQDALLRRWLESAVRDAIHETLEWFQVDGAPLLDPHGIHADLIHQISGEAAEGLSRLAE